MAAHETYPCAERVHRAFRGNIEVAKWLRTGTLITEVASAAVASIRILDPNLPWPGWASLALAALIILGIVLHLWADSIIAIAERCRRVAIRAYGMGLDLSQLAAASLISDSSKLGGRFAAGLPTQTLDEYYEAQADPGPARIRELYGHSAFYSWKIRRVLWQLCAMLAIVSAMAGFGVIYALASAPSESTTSSRLLDLVCSVVFVFLTAKAAVAAVKVRASYFECRRIAESLVGQPASKDPSELVADYDIELANGITNPTFLYLWMRDDLQREWHELRVALP